MFSSFQTRPVSSAAGTTGGLSTAPSSAPGAAAVPAPGAGAGGSTVPQHPGLAGLPHVALDAVARALTPADYLSFRLSSREVLHATDRPGVATAVAANGARAHLRTLAACLAPDAVPAAADLEPVLGAMRFLRSAWPLLERTPASLHEAEALVAAVQAAVHRLAGPLRDTPRGLDDLLRLIQTWLSLVQVPGARERCEVPHGHAYLMMQDIMAATPPGSRAHTLRLLRDCFHRSPHQDPGRRMHRDELQDMARAFCTPEEAAAFCAELPALEAARAAEAPPHEPPLPVSWPGLRRTVRGAGPQLYIARESFERMRPVVQRDRFE